MRAPPPADMPPAEAGQYFPHLDALKHCAESAVKGAKSKRDKEFAAQTLERVSRYGVRTRMSSKQASWLQRIAKQHTVDVEVEMRWGK